MKHTRPSRQPKLTPEAFILREQGLTLLAIARKFGVSKVAVHHYLNRHRTRFNHPSIERRCANCNKSGWYTKNQDPQTAYCSPSCYFISLAEHPYQENRHGQRLGRKEVSNHYGLIPDGAIVHHEDGNCLNNERCNLVLFASQADHLKHHRNCVHNTPLWSGVPLICNHNE